MIVLTHEWFTKVERNEKTYLNRIKYTFLNLGYFIPAISLPICPGGPIALSTLREIFNCDTPAIHFHYSHPLNLANFQKSSG
jgi:hypothetical protein